MSSNSSEEWWSILDPDGKDVSLHQWGWSVTTVGGSRYNLPPRRGSDIVLSGRPGQIHRRKLPDARPITLVMFMVGWDPAAGSAPPDQRTQWNDNWDTLRRLVYRHSMAADQRVKLTRRWFLTAPAFPTTRTGDQCIAGDPGVPAPGKRLLTAFAWAEMTGTMEPAMTGRLRSDFQLDFNLADPFFYGDPVSFTMTAGKTVYVWNDGHDVAANNYVQIDLYGQLTNPRIVNLSTQPDTWVQFTGTLGVLDHLALDVGRFQCLNVKTGYNHIGKVTSNAETFWLNLLPGMNKLRLDGTGAGNVVITFRPPYV